LNPKAYYTKHIKKQNDAHLAKQKLNQLRALSVIHRFGGDPDEQAKRAFAQNFDKHMR